MVGFVRDVLFSSRTKGSFRIRVPGKGTGENSGDEYRDIKCGFGHLRLPSRCQTDLRHSQTSRFPFLFNDRLSVCVQTLVTVNVTMFISYVKRMCTCNFYQSF